MWRQFFCSCSKSSQRALDELQRTIVEIETKYKAEISRLKKKYETEIREYEIQVETLTRTNAELAKNNKALSARVKVTIFIQCQFKKKIHYLLHERNQSKVNIRLFVVK